MTDTVTIRRELLERIQHLKHRIAELRERLPYADGQAYYDDKRKIEALTAELNELAEIDRLRQQLRDEGDRIAHLRTAMETILPYVKDKRVTGRKPLKDGVYTMHIGQIIRDALDAVQPPASAAPRQPEAVADEREAFEAWLGITPCGAAHDLAVRAFQAGAAYQRQSEVVMPDRRIQALAGVSLFDLGHAKGWNACLDEFARLNRSKTNEQ